MSSCLHSSKATCKFTRDRMNWGPLVEQAFLVGLTQIAAVVFVVGLVVGLAIVMKQRR